MFTAAVITVSDRSFRGERPDAGGPLVAEILQSAGYKIQTALVVPDEQIRIEAALRAQIQALTRSLPHDGTRNGMKSERHSKRLMLRRIRLHPRPASCTLLPHGRGAGSVYGTKTRQAAGITRAACLDMNITVRYRTA